MRTLRENPWRARFQTGADPKPDARWIWLRGKRLRSDARRTPAAAMEHKEALRAMQGELSKSSLDAVRTVTTSLRTARDSIFLESNMTKTDVVIIGAGHNGLTCAAYLARAGLAVRVVDRRKVLGGAAVTEELHPGFRNS